jgi:His-Xaa-Ser system radical SAM maturase HxsC
MAVSSPPDTVLVCRGGRVPEADLTSFAAVLVEGDRELDPSAARIGVYKSLDHLEAGDLVLIDGRSGHTRTLFRTASIHNALFVTERCNSNCLMCSQPAKHRQDELLGICLRLIELLQFDPPRHLGITGGEPTLLGEGFLEIIAALKAHLPETTVTCLSNGRMFADSGLAAAVAGINLPGLRFSIPLHASVPDLHDYIAQAKGAFNETVAGLYNLAANGVKTEIRVVLHALSTPHLVTLAEYIYRKLPFVEQVAFMGLEHMGYVKKNWDRLRIDPADYTQRLGAAVEHLYRRGMNVSIYNLPLCVLPREIWGFSRQSISDHKKVLPDECSPCDVLPHCTGFFVSSKERYSGRIQPITLCKRAGAGRRGGAKPSSCCDAG